MIYAVLQTFNERNRGGLEREKNPDTKLNITTSADFQNPTPAPLRRVNILMCV